MQVLSVSNLFKSSKSNFYFGVLASLIVGLGLFLSFIQPGFIDIDAGIFSAVALKNLNNGGLYISTWENKPPGLIYLMQALFFLFSNKVYALFFLAMFGASAISVGVYLLYYKYFESLLIAVLFTTFSLAIIIQPQFFGDGLYTEILGAIFILFALVFYDYKSDISNSNYFICAVLAGSSFWFKEPFILAAIVIAFLLFVKIKNQKERLWLFFWFCVPSIFFILLLFLNGSLTAFVETIIYNFSYVNDTSKTSFSEKWSLLNQFLFQPVFAVSIAFLVLLYLNLKKGKEILEIVFFILLLISSSGLFMLSPYSFGHYYLPFIIIFFIVFAKLFAIYKKEVKTVNYLLLGLVLYLSYNTIIDLRQPNFVYKITRYEPDRIAQKLLVHRDKTLFIDYVNKTEYYVKGNMVHHAFLPAPLPVHFQTNSKIGQGNIQRIWTEMNAPKADFLITTNTPAYFYWSLPNHYFYEEFYEKIDSIHKKDENVVYLWQLKKK